MPVLHVGGNVHHVAWQQLACGLAPLLIPAAASHTDEELTTTVRGVVDVPVVAAAGLEGDVVDGNLFRGDGGEIALSDEVFGVSGIRLTDGEYHLALELCLSVCRGVAVGGPHLLGLAEGRPRFGSPDVESDVGEHLRNLLPRDAVGFGIL